jgi:hypothetical protein
MKVFGELGRNVEETVITIFKVLCGFRVKTMTNTMTNIGKGRRYPGWDSKRAHQEYKW